jgi:hypothetical protein
VGFRHLRYASAPANIHRASGAEEFASKIFQRAVSGKRRIDRKRTLRMSMRFDFPNK